jgi:hypothetical protein
VYRAKCLDFGESIVLLSMRISRKFALEPLIAVQGRIIDELADGCELVGTLESLAYRFGQTPDDLLSCLRELVAARWIVTRVLPLGQLSLRLERRVADTDTVHLDRRLSPPQDAWRL